MAKRILAILCSDLHLSLNPPVARSVESSWLDAQARVLKQVADLADEFGGCPVIIAGDLFDRPSPPAELINFAIDHLPPNVYAIPGQHDLPLHRYEDIHKSGYWTLAKAGAISDLGRGGDWTLLPDGKLCVYAFPWGEEVKPFSSGVGSVQLAVIHSYCWVDGKGYPGAPELYKLGAFSKALEGYSAAVFGDNHQSFIGLLRGSRIACNCGCLIRRKIDEKKHKPMVGLLQDDYDPAAINPHYLDCSEDRWIDQPEEKVRNAETSLDMDRFMEELASLDGSDLFDFRAVLRQWTDNPDNKVSRGAKAVLVEILEGIK